MKKTAALLIALALLLCAGAFALNGADYPAWDGASSPPESLCGEFGSEKLLLEFDPSSDYSGAADGMVQACFFAFDKAEQNYLEFYLLLPQTAAAGDVFAPGGSAMTSISLYEVFLDGEDLYFAGQVAGLAYPQNSGYELRISSAETRGGVLSMSGTLNGSLIRFEDDVPTDEVLQLSDVRFSFSLPLASDAAPQTAAPSPSATEAPRPSLPPRQDMPTAKPKAAQPTLDPHPAFTLPPDYAVL